MRFSDNKYERSIIKQLYLSNESRHLFQKNAYSVSIESYGDVKIATKVEIINGREVDRNKIDLLKSHLLVRGADLTNISIEIIYGRDISENTIKNIVIEIKNLKNFRIDGISVFGVEELKEEVFILLRGSGRLRSLKEAPFIADEIYAGQEIVMSGQLDMGTVPFKNDELESVKTSFSRLYQKRISKDTKVRLPLAEVELAPYYGVSAIQSCACGGILAALYHIGDRKKAGLRVNFEKFNISQPLVEVCERLKREPLGLDSYGVYLISSFNADDLVYALGRAGMVATKIGTVTDELKRVVVFYGEEERYVESPK